MARPSALADPDFCHNVAEAFVAGLTRREMADMFAVGDLNTITKWRRDPRVQVIAKKMIQDRVLEITRKVDSQMAVRLEQASELSIRELIEIRKEYMGDKLRQQTDEIDENTVNEALSFLDENPEAAAAVRKLLTGNRSEE
jgi:hypothetical protein